MPVMTAPFCLTLPCSREFLQGSSSVPSSRGGSALGPSPDAAAAGAAAAPWRISTSSEAASTAGASCRMPWLQACCESSSAADAPASLCAPLSLSQHAVQTCSVPISHTRCMDCHKHTLCCFLQMSGRQMRDPAHNQAVQAALAVAPAAMAAMHPETPRGLLSCGHLLAGTLALRSCLLCHLPYQMAGVSAAQHLLAHR